MGATPTSEEYKSFAAEVAQAEQEAKEAQKRYLELNEKLQSLRGALAAPGEPNNSPVPN